MVDIFIVLSLIFLIIKVILFFTPGVEKYYNLISLISMVVPIFFILIAILIIIKDKTDDLIRYLKKIKEIGIKNTIQYYKNEKQKLKEFSDFIKNNPENLFKDFYEKDEK